MNEVRRNEITSLILATLAQSPHPRRNPMPYGRMVLAIQHCSDISRHEIDHVLVALCCRLVINLIGGEVCFCGSAELLKPESMVDPDRIDWVFGSGRYGTG